MKRTLSLLLSLLMLVALIPASAEEATVITVSGPDSVNSLWGETLTIQELQKRTNTRWDITLYPADVWKTKLNLLITSDALPDIVFKADADKSEINIYGEEGYFLDLSKYLDIMPNLCKIFEEHPDYKAYHTTESGAIYSLANLSIYPGQRVQPLVYLNKTWLDNLGLTYPETVEELYTVLKAFKEQDANGNGDPNDEIPVSFDTSAGARLEHVLRAAFGIYTSELDLMYQVGSDGKVYLAETTEDFKDYLTFMHRLYAEGLLDETTFIQTAEERREKVVNNQVGMFSDWGGLSASTCGQNVPEAYDTWAWVNGFGSEKHEKAYAGWPLVNAGAKIMVNAKTEHPKEICKMIDYMFTDEYVTLYDYGVEGQTFEYITTESGAKIPAIMKSAWEGKYDSEAAFKDQYINVTQLMVMYYSAYYKVCGAAGEEELQKMKLDPILCNNANREEFVRTTNMVDTYPRFSYNTEEAEVQGRYKTDLTTYLNTMRVAFITGEANLETDWDNYQNTIRSMSLDKLLAAEQSAYDRYAANLK